MVREKEEENARELQVIVHSAQIFIFTSRAGKGGGGEKRKDGEEGMKSVRSTRGKKKRRGEGEEKARKWGENKRNISTRNR